MCMKSSQLWLMVTIKPCASCSIQQPLKMAHLLSNTAYD